MMKALQKTGTVREFGESLSDVYVCATNSDMHRCEDLEVDIPKRESFSEHFEHYPLGVIMEELRDIVEQTRVSQDKERVFVKPSVVVEATYQEIQETDDYTSDYVLRVPKIVRFRPDKKIEEIDSIEKLHKLYEMQYERHPFQSL